MSYSATEHSHLEPSEDPEVERLRTELALAIAELSKARARDPRVAAQLLMLFGRIAAILLVLIVVFTALLALFQPDKDIAGLTALLNTQLSIIIGAVLGYAAHPEGVQHP